ncbi:MAG: Rap1a/Tai family immunity protein [Methylococcales bacterium]|nr:Rap1a/Tai family immunity protein [Methylococcales bacterium]
MMAIVSEGSYADSFTDVNRLSEWMLAYNKNRNSTTTDLIKSGNYHGYIINIVDGALGGNTNRCFPKNSQDGQYIKIVSKFLENNPDKLHYSANSLIFATLQEAFPCKK